MTPFKGADTTLYLLYCTMLALAQHIWYLVPAFDMQGISSDKKLQHRKHHSTPGHRDLTHNTLRHNNQHIIAETDLHNITAAITNIAQGTDCVMKTIVNIEDLRRTLFLWMIRL